MMNKTRKNLLQITIGIIYGISGVMAILMFLVNMWFILAVFCFSILGTILLDDNFELKGEKK